MAHELEKQISWTATNEMTLRSFMTERKLLKGGFIAELKQAVFTYGMRGSKRKFQERLGVMGGGLKRDCPRGTFV